MTFLRTKKINNNFYCYLVQNKHTKKGPRQKVKKYLGRAWKLEQKKELDFLDFLKVNNFNDYFKKSKKEILMGLVQWELIRHGFQEKKDSLVNQDISFNIKNNKIIKKDKEVLLALNEGFLCSFTTGRILKFKKSGDLQKDALTLAKYFVEAGIKIPQEVFIGFYEKH
ncbi:hypothetical protein GOV03_00165 [Candidatus Woesearchaeota archaeon]|nr:hypothetical protein [Candidatus Woesearchaeota archaeon]